GRSYRHQSCPGVIMQSGKTQDTGQAADAGISSVAPASLPDSEPTQRADNPTDALAVEPLLRVAALGALIYACVILLLPFISIIVWSIVLAVALYPGFKWISFWLGGRSRIAAALVTLLALLLVIGPATWLILGLIDSVRTIYDHFDLSKVSL